MTKLGGSSRQGNGDSGSNSPGGSASTAGGASKTPTIGCLSEIAPAARIACGQRPRMWDLVPARARWCRWWLRHKPWATAFLPPKCRGSTLRWLGRPSWCASFAAAGHRARGEAGASNSSARACRPRRQGGRRGTDCPEGCTRQAEWSSVLVGSCASSLGPFLPLGRRKRQRAGPTRSPFCFLFSAVILSLPSFAAQG